MSVMEGILGKKIGMTHVFVGMNQIPVTVVEAGPSYVVQKKTKATDGYEAVQIGFGDKRPSRVNKPLTGHYKKYGTPTTYHLKEFKALDIDAIKPGQTIKCSDVFEVGQFVDVTGTSKGRGFQGVVKRWNFKGGPGGHGSKHGRTSGSVGQGADPGRVFKGMRMPGQMGNKQITTQNLEIVDIKADENVILIKGALPGSVGSLVVIKKALKR